VLNVQDSAQSASIIRAIIALGHGLKLPVLAEGVETDEQFAFLLREGCDEVQGHLFARPGSIEQFAHLIGRTTPARGPIVPDAA
jgi:EAL domain-containing protein (putative c-di-GMP-specific phosphodiesterase class I)